MTQVQGFSDKVGFIWSVADLLRGDYKAHEYGQVILPLTVLRRLDAVLAPTKPAVIAKAEELAGKIENPEKILLRTAGQPFFNTSPFDFARLLDAAPSLVATFAPMWSFSRPARSWRFARAVRQGRSPS